MKGFDMGTHKTVVWCFALGATMMCVLFTQVRSCDVATDTVARHADEVKAVEETKASVARSRALEACVEAGRPPLECRELVK